MFNKILIKIINMTTFNLELNAEQINSGINYEVKKILIELSNYTGISVNEYLTGLVNGEKHLKDLKALHAIYHEKNNPNKIVYSHDQVGKMLGLKD